ncbi:MAG: hypothetical protein ACD_24C00154G0001 [uncultured bacterium]|nr:MAG: hypothetical protein ACD_24C00154G0001 [uncultured bacterium]
MEVHYTKHHKTYLDKLTMAITGTPLENMELEDILMSPEAIDENIRTAVINNGGGVFNHNFFWSVIGPAKSTGPDGMLLEKINGTFGSFDMFKEEFTKSALGLFGSGWTWLVQDKEGNVKIMNTQNQASPISEGYKPLLALDVWEHAYYLKYQNRRADYITNWWNIVDWANITL